MSSFVRSQVQDLVNKAVKEWIEENNYEKIRKEVFQELNRIRATITLSLMGLEKNHWNNTYKVTKNTQISNYIYSSQEKAIKEWVDAVIPEIHNIKIPQSAKESVFKECKKKILSDVQERLRELSEQRSCELVSECINNLDKLTDMVDEK